MNQTRGIILWTFILLLNAAKGQDLDYLLSLNQPAHYGDARFNAMSGAMTAMSGSFTALTQNPAGAALYRQTAYGWDFGTFLNTTFEQPNHFLKGSAITANIGNLGIVFPSIDGKYRFFVTYNSDHLYRSAFDFTRSNVNSMALSIMDEAQGIQPENLSTQASPYADMLYQSYAVDFDPISGTYYSTADLYQTNYTHDRARKGLKGQFTGGVSGSIGSTLFYGANLKLVHSLETVTIRHRETYAQTTDLNSFQSDETWTNSGVGLGGSAGILYRPIQSLRLAASLELPTLMGFNQNWNTTFSVNRPLINGSTLEATGYGDAYNWGLLLAPKVYSGLTFLAGRSALVTFNHTFIPHHWTLTTSKNERYLIDALKVQAQSQHIWSMGTEVRMGPISLRGGMRYIPEYQLETGNTWGTSFGFAMKTEEFSFSMGWSKLFQNHRYFPFSSSYSNAFLFEQRSTYFNAGAVWKF
jgi:hypothetical protein